MKGEVHTMEFMADTVHAAMETLGIGRAVVVGHSMGGYVALEMLRKYPEAFAGLVLFHSTPNQNVYKRQVKMRARLGSRFSARSCCVSAEASRSRQRISSLSGV